MYQDINDEQVAFSHQAYQFRVPENAARGTIVGRVEGRNPHRGPNDQDIAYWLHPTDGGPLYVNPTTGELILAESVDRDPPANQRAFKFDVRARDQLSKNLFNASVPVTLVIDDINDNSPKFNQDKYVLELPESLPIGTGLPKFYKVSDIDDGDNGKIVHYWLNSSDAVQIDNPLRQASAKVEIEVLDVNDNAPVFEYDTYNITVMENLPPGFTVVQVYAQDKDKVKAVDPDLGLNGLVTYSLQNDSLTQTVPFVVDHHNGSVLIHTSFSDIRVKPSRYTFFVIASDQASIVSERRTSSAVINIEVRDVNNNPPEFLNAPYEAFVGESLPPGAMVFQLEAKDPDANTVLQYNIVAGNDEGLFAVDTRTGRVVTAAVLDYETRQQYDVLVQASDGVNTAVSPLTIHVVDINDQQPVFTHNFYNLSTVEEIEGEVTVGAILAVDGDSGRNAAVRYRILGDRANEAFRVADDGSLHTRRRLDREREPQLEFLVVAFDGGTPQLSGTATVAVTVLDINDNPPHFNTDTFVVHVPEEEDPPKTIFHMKVGPLLPMGIL
ncbi:hypothetical protein LAZ67_9002574 [Cordylochernes scorpioides]|uniref:Cadherin domain-containing protein n=1 Tax=Cordylochernes scorpioides TaxID=51811 RepID=A0ABY6KTW5_9ARAC|nr:hypothetical protein LAZ67_9002574 [Cordylochernes scorpioides]